MDEEVYIDMKGAARVLQLSVSCLCCYYCSAHCCLVLGHAQHARLARCRFTARGPPLRLPLAPPLLANPICTDVSLLQRQRSSC